MNRLIVFLRNILEPRVFGVCASLGELLGIKSGNIRLFFIYTTFLTAGSPLILYMIMAFILEHRTFFFSRRYKKKLPGIFE